MDPSRERLAIRHGGAAVLLARLCQQMRIRPIVNAMVRWDPAQCKVSPGTLVVALIPDLLLDREPLYKVKEFYRRRDLELLFEEPVDLEALNDDALGRALDRLAAIDQPQLLQTVGLSAVHLGEMELRSVHADSFRVTNLCDVPLQEVTIGDVRIILSQAVEMAQGNFKIGQLLGHAVAQSDSFCSAPAWQGCTG